MAANAELSVALGTALVERANSLVAADQATYGDPSSLIEKECRQVEATLANAGLLRDGIRVEPRHVIAIKAGFAQVGLVNAVDPTEALARFIAVGVAGSPIVATGEATKGDGFDEDSERRAA